MVLSGARAPLKPHMGKNLGNLDLGIRGQNRCSSSGPWDSEESRTGSEEADSFPVSVCHSASVP